MGDTYLTLSQVSEGLYKEKMSRFISFAYPVSDKEEIREHLERLQKEYYDARHICYAYMLGHERKDFRANDNGEPSGSAGKPILGQINSFNLTDVLVVVVRYFGGVKLGTGGLAVAYRESAKEAILNNEIVEKRVGVTFRIRFEYPFLNDVMRIVKEESPEILGQVFDMDCEMKLSIRQSLAGQLQSKLSKVETLQIEQ